MFDINLISLLFNFGIPIGSIIFLLYYYLVLYKNTNPIKKQQFLMRSGILLFIFTMVAYDIYPPYINPDYYYSSANIHDWIKILLYALFWTMIVLGVVRTHNKLPDDVKQKYINVYLYSAGTYFILQHIKIFIFQYIKQPNAIDRFFVIKGQLITYTTDNNVLAKESINYVEAFVVIGIIIIMINWLALRKMRNIKQ